MKAADTESSSPLTESNQHASSPPSNPEGARNPKRKRTSIRRRAPSFDWNTIKTLNIRPSQNTSVPISQPASITKVPIWMKPPAGPALGSIAALPPGTQIPFIVTTTAQGLPALVPLPLKPTSAVSQSPSTPVSSTITSPPPAFPMSSSKSSDVIPMILPSAPPPTKLVSPERDRAQQVMGLPPGLPVFDETEKRALDHEEIKRLRSERAKLEDELRKINALLAPFD